MASTNRSRKNRYDRVMSRVHSQSQSSVRLSSTVTRHDIPSSVRVGAKTAGSNVSSGFFNELPTFLDDYEPESGRQKVKRTFVVKPRKTITSMKLADCPPRVASNFSKARETSKKSPTIRVQESAPSVLQSNGDKWSDTHLRECFSSRSHTHLKDLKDEIKAYKETERLMRLRSSLYKKCGVVLDDVGNMVEDKAVQAQPEETLDDDTGQEEKRAEREYVGPTVGAAVPHQQMRSLVSPYPVDRYLVESSKKFEMVNIIDDDIWNTEPALKPEDEIILRKLHDTLQSTADDLKLLSGELTKFREPGVQVKTIPTPLDEEFNEKVHIEEIVNAKFHGYKIIDKSASNMPEYKSKKEMTNENKPSADSKYHKSPNINAPVNVEKINKKSINRNLGITRTKIIQITGDTNSTKTEKLNNGTVVNAPAVAYNEYSYVYVEPKPKMPSKKLQVQEMPSINIRSELKEQKVLQLDILPEVKKCETPEIGNNNVTVVAIHHETCKPVQRQSTVELRDGTQRHQLSQQVTSRKVSKMSTCDSSGSTNSISSDTKINLKTQKRILTNIRTSPKMSARNDRKKRNIKKEPEHKAHLDMDEWRKKLNSVYGSTSSKKTKSPQSKIRKPTLKKSNTYQDHKAKPSNLNNTEYIPYSKLTVGGARASDIEREISDIPNKRDIPLSPILDRILSSRENSFSLKQTHQPNEKGNIFTTSDENLLQEVIDIEKTVSETLSKHLNNINSKPQIEGSGSEEAKDNDSYADDFEEEKSDRSGQSENRKTNTNSISNDDQDNIESFDKENDTSDKNEGHKGTSKNNIARKLITNSSCANIQLNETYRKTTNLSFKNKVDVFEYIHSIDTQDSATQSNTELKLSRKETQTSPINDNSIQPIHNDLWPRIDPKGEVEKMFQIEKDFIKKLIVEEYGDLLERNIDKPSTSKSKEVQITLNVAASQKNTQTSPAHVKNVMTSPTKTRNRTTSPFSKITVDHHTSPLIFVVDEDDVKLEVENEDDPGISINLSSPRFSLRLPRTSREVLSNLGNSVPRTAKQSASKMRYVKKNNITSTSTSSFEADSSEISSLGEVKLARKLGRARMVSETDSISSSSMSELHSGILPLKSEGEMSVSHKQKNHKQQKSEGEASVGLF